MDRPPLNVPESATRASGNFGRLALALAALSLLSGAALVPFYDPAAPLPSLERITGGLPWGAFLRSLHAWSSFLLLAATVVHAFEVVWKRTEAQLPPAVWWRSLLLLPLVVLALLGGFVLKGDAEAQAAAEVWRSVMASVPLVGRELATLFLGPQPASLGAVALHHAGTLSILIVLFSLEHGKLLWPGARPATLAALAATAAAGLVIPSLGPPPPGPSDHGPLLGPWALLGLQGLLVDLPAAAAWLLPLAGLLLVGTLRHARGKSRTVLLVLLGGGVILYAAATVRALLPARP